MEINDLLYQYMMGFIYAKDTDLHDRIKRDISNDHKSKAVDRKITNIMDEANKRIIEIENKKGKNKSGAEKIET